jgi:hypothetical protein
MKKIQLTAAALALIAAAVFTNSAKAQDFPTGDIIFGVYDSAASGAAPNSYEVDLGSFSSLTVGETFNIGTSLASTFTSDATPSLVFDIAGTGGTGAGGLAAKQIAVTSPLPYVVPTNYQTTTPNLNIANEYGSLGSSTVLGTGLSSTGTTFTEVSDANTDPDAFEQTVNDSGGSYGINGGQSGNILTSYTIGSTVTTDFFTEATKQQPVLDGLFEITGSGASTQLVFEGLSSTPEPTTYGLMVGGMLALFAFMRRRSNA